MRAEEGIDSSDGMDEDKLRFLFCNETLDAGDDDGLDIEHAIEGRNHGVFINLSFSFQNGIKDSFLLQNLGAEVVEVDVEGGDAFLLQAFHQAFHLLWNG